MSLGGLDPPLGMMLHVGEGSRPPPRDDAVRSDVPPPVGATSACSRPPAVARARDHGRAPGGRQTLCCALLSGSPGPAERNLSEAEQASVDGEAGAGAAGDGFLDKTVSPPVRRRPQAA